MLYCILNRDKDAQRANTRDKTYSIRSNIMKINHFGDVLAFVKVADSQSFTQTAEQLGISRSAVGKCITRLEENLSTRLVHRTTRSVRLTEEGRLFYEHAMRILCEVDDAEATLAQRNQTPKGRLRIDLPILAINSEMPWQCAICMYESDFLMMAEVIKTVRSAVFLQIGR